MVKRLDTRCLGRVVGKRGSLPVAEHIAARNEHVVVHPVLQHVGRQDAARIVQSVAASLRVKVNGIGVGGGGGRDDARVSGENNFRIEIAGRAICGNGSAISGDTHVFSLETTCYWVRAVNFSRNFRQFRFGRDIIGSDGIGRRGRSLPGCGLRGIAYRRTSGRGGLTFRYNRRRTRRGRRRLCSGLCLLRLRRTAVPCPLFPVP